jgi:hypothetical protein
MVNLYKLSNYSYYLMSTSQERIPGFTASYSIEKKREHVELARQVRRISFAKHTVALGEHIIPQQDIETDAEQFANGNEEEGLVEGDVANECTIDPETGQEVCP